MFVFIQILFLIICNYYCWLLQNELDMQMVQTEISSLKVLHHNNIARLLQLIETDEQFFIIREVWFYFGVLEL